MTLRRLMLCDVFTSIPMLGNGLAVILQADHMTTHDMQNFANWIGHAETAFLAEPSDRSADYSVRIFTPDRELRFAGHPTIGSAAAWIRAGGRPRDAGLLRQECGIGIVDIDISGDVPAFVAPPTKIARLPQDRLASITQALEIDPNSVLNALRLDNGPVWEVLELGSTEDVLRIKATDVLGAGGGSVGLFAAATGPDRQFEVRMLSASAIRCEDPVTGSLMAALAVWLQVEGRCPEPAIAAQGTCVGRAGQVHLIPDRKDLNRMLIGGDTIFISDSLIKL